MVKNAYLSIFTLTIVVMNVGGAVMSMCVRNPCVKPYVMGTLILVFYCLGVTPSDAQYVRDTSFCFEVKNHECLESIPHGSKININDLHKLDGNRVIYFWANLRNPSESAVSVYMIRNGECYKPKFVVPNEKLYATNNLLETFGAFLSSARPGELLRYLGVSKVGPEVELEFPDIRVNVVFLPEANIYRIDSHRFVTCPGELNARILDSEGKPIPGFNPVKIVLYE